MPESDPRNQSPPSDQWRFWTFWAVVSLAGAVVTVVALPDFKFLSRSDASLWVILGLLLLLELGPLVRRKSRPVYGLASSLMFMFALLMQWGLAVAIVGQAITMILAGFLRRRAIWRTIVNIALCALCLGAAHLVLTLFSHEGSLRTAETIDAWTLVTLPLAGLVWLCVNSLLAGTLSALKYHSSWWREVKHDNPPAAALNDGAAIALAPLVVLAAERSALLVPMLLIPLFAVYRGNVASLALKHQAGHDPLTELPNRTLLLDRAAQAFASMAVQGSVVGLFVLDLDRFKEVNDTLGHPAGDKLLQVIARRLVGAVRPGDLVARLGGDEFAVVLPNVGDQASARVVAARIAAAVRAPLHLDGVMLKVGSSLGIALAPEHGTDFETLLQRADLAMYAAKERGTSSETYSSDLAIARQAS